MSFREKFNEIQKPEEKATNENLTELIQRLESGQQKYEDYHSGGLLGIDTEDTHQGNDIFAFILEERFSVASYGINYSIDFGIIKNGKVYNRGFRTARGGMPNDIDDFHGWYKEIKILEEGKEPIIALKSGKALDIYKINLESETMERLQRYDLEAEQLEREKQELQEQAEQTENFTEKLHKLGEKLSKNYQRARKPCYKIIEHNGKQLGVIAIETYDRDYDASTEEIDFYILEQGENEPKLVLSKTPDYDRSQTWGERFFSVSARKEISDTVIEEQGKLKIPVKVEVIGSFNCGGAYSCRRDLGEDSFELEYELGGK